MTRTLPHSPDAEASILGGIFLRNGLLSDLPELEVEAFYDHRHKLVFSAMRTLESKAQPIDLVTVENELARMGRIDAVGGVGFLGELTVRIPTLDNAMAYAQIVADKHQARRLMLAASEVVERGYEADLDIAEYLDQSEAEVLSATARRSKADDALDIGACLKARFREIDETMQARARGTARLTGCPTGVAALDERIGGWPWGVVSVLAGRPGIGKTSLAVATALAAADAGHGVDVYSLEEPNAMYADRVLASSSGVAAEKMRNGSLQRADLDPITRASAKVKQYSDRWTIDTRGGLSAREIVRSARRRRKRNRTRVVVVDHMQIVAREPRLDENAALEQIVNAFAAAAKDVDENGQPWAWVVLCQLNRKCEERTDRRPIMSDLRGSGAIEASARLIVMQYRGSYYYPDAKPDIDYDCSCPPKTPVGACGHRPGQHEFERQAQLVIAKNNNGPTGRVFATWTPETMRIE